MFSCFCFNSFVTNFVNYIKRLVKSFISCHQLLEPGVYAILSMAFRHWQTSIQTVRQYPEYLRPIHSSKPLLIERVIPPKHVLVDAVINLTTANGRKHGISKGMTAYYLTNDWSGLVIVAENGCPDLHLQVKSNCSGSINVVSIRATLNTVEYILPLHRQVLIVLTQLEGSEGLVVQYQLTHRIDYNMTALGDWGNDYTDCQHIPAIDSTVAELHSSRPL